MDVFRLVFQIVGLQIEMTKKLQKRSLRDLLRRKTHCETLKEI